MRSKAAVLGGAIAGAVGALLLRRRRSHSEAPAEPDARTEELRRKLAEAREAAEHEDEFQAAGMGAETIVEEPAEADVDEARRRVHEAGRARAEEMRKSGDDEAEA